MEIIRSLSNPKVKRLVKLRKESTFRKEEKSCIVLGKGMVEEISRSIPPKQLILTEGEESNIPSEKLYVSSDVLAKITGVSTASTLAAEFPLPEPSDLTGLKKILILDRVNNPGNLGTLLRSAIAFGWNGIFLLEGCADPFSDKALRASKGALFSIPYFIGDHDTLRSLNLSQLLVAELEGKAFSNINLANTVGLILGNESQGPSQESLSIAEPITIPMSNSMESLNVAVAGGILLYHYSSLNTKGLL